MLRAALCAAAVTAAAICAAPAQAERLTVSQYGMGVEEIFVNYKAVKDLVGEKEIENIPLGAIGIYSYSDKIRVGLQQLMAGARRFNIGCMNRKDLMSLTEECTKVTGIPYVMDAYMEEAEEILNS